MKNFWEWLKGTIKNIFNSIVENLLEKPLKTFLYIIVSAFGIYIAPDIQQTYIKTFVADEKMRNQLQIVVEQNKKLSEFLQTAEATNIFQRKDFEKKFHDFSSGTNKSFQLLQDSISRLHKKIVEISKGQGTVIVEGKGITKEGNYSDAWIEAKITQKENEYGLDYHFNFEISDVQVATEDDNGIRSEIYSVNINSTKDPSQKIYLGDYRKEITVLAVKPIEIEQPQEISFNGDIATSGNGTEVSASISFFTIGNGAKEKNIYFRLPEIGVASNFRDSHNIYFGFRYNLGSLLPLFQDLYVSAKYGYNFGKQKSNIVIGIGSTL